MKFSHIFWFILVLIWNIETVINLINHTFSFNLFNCFISILGIFVLIYQTKLLFEDIKDKQQKKELVLLFFSKAMNKNFQNYNSNNEDLEF